MSSESSHSPAATDSESARHRYLVPIAGPPLEAMVLTPTGSPMTLGRYEGCELRTPPSEDRVSRFHARFIFQDGKWYVSDLKSTWGTFLNGYRLPAERPHVLVEGDLLRITPWTLSFCPTGEKAGSVLSLDDTSATLLSIRPIAAEHVSAPGEPLTMLVEAAAVLHQVSDEQTLAALLADFGRKATGYTSAAYLKPTDAQGRVEVMAAAPAREESVYSRSLLQMASAGQMAVMEGPDASAATAQSIIQMQISSALCVPLMLGQAVAAYLYLDIRQPGAHLNARAHEYCLALARIASLALANLKRVDIERRQAAMESQLERAGMIQRYLLPQGAQRLGPLVVTGTSRPGQMLGGDFYDVIPLTDGRVALTLGDVSGKGITASVLMTTIHGFLHGLLEGGVQLTEAVTRLNAFLEPRKPPELFATMFAAVIDSDKGLITYVDAGHGYGLLWSSGNAIWLHEGGGPPLGISPDTAFKCGQVKFAAGEALVVVSDGIIEQTAPDGREQFDTAGVENALRKTPGGGDELEEILGAVQKHAGTTALADDATILVARW